MFTLHRFLCLLVAIIIFFVTMPFIQAAVIFDTTDGVTEYSGLYRPAVGMNVYPTYFGGWFYGASGMAFTVPMGEHLLTSLFLPIFWEEGANSLSVRILSETAPQSGSLPDTLIATLTDFSYQWPAFYSDSGSRIGSHIAVTDTVVLEGGKRYWVAAYPNIIGLASTFKWMLTPAGYVRSTDNGWDANYTGHFPTGVWVNAGSTPDLALKVYATPIPEPITFTHLCLVLFCMCLWQLIRFKRDRKRLSTLIRFRRTASGEPATPGAQLMRSEE